MRKIGILYWPLKGNVEKIAYALSSKLDGYEVEIKDLGLVNTDDLLGYDYLIFGNSTVGASNWEDATDDNKWYIMFHELEGKKVDFGGKKAALFSLGDQVNYPHHFVDSLEIVYSQLSARNLNIVGEWPNQGYEFYESKALHDGFFRGLVLDSDNQKDLDDERLAAWVSMLKQEFTLGD